MILAQCFVIDDESSGWKQIALPPGAPHLAASEAYEQFRGQEPALVTWDTAQVVLSTRETGLGKVTVETAIPANARAATVRFARPLDGARVDAVLVGDWGRIPVHDGRRFAGNEVTVRIPVPESQRLVLTVHHHLRAEPTLELIRVEALVIPARAFPNDRRDERALYVFNPGGPVTLCNRPGQALTVSTRLLEDRKVVTPRIRALTRETVP
ncbi:MAG: hypothetical protein JNJ54_10645 [Myxococcaceae bacterium]|nr:hypothetical protein [Myxococcaceae bacterium]